jgi:hypothetical protein
LRENPGGRRLGAVFALLEGMRNEITLPLGTAAEYERDLEFGICENCKNVGVKIFKCSGHWVCHRCACSLAGSKAGIEKINPSN